MAIDLDDVIRLHGAGLARTASSYERNPALCEELLQDIFLALVTALPRLRDPSRTKAFVFKVAHHRCVSHIMRRVRERHNAISEAFACPDDAPSQEQEMIAGQRSTALMEAVRRLKLPYRQVVTLVLEELSYEEIAEILGLSVSNVGVRVNRAKRQIKEMMAHD